MISRRERGRPVEAGVLQVGGGLVRGVQRVTVGGHVKVMPGR